MTPVVVLERACAHEAGVLARISREAFNADTACGAQSEGGPPGYDRAEWQRTMMQRATAYLKILVGEEIVGGLIVFRMGPRHFELGRLFVSPPWQRRGIGARAMGMLLQSYPECRKWTLGTPAWNSRTRAFYPKVGFRLVRETQRELLFERLLP